MTSAYSPSSESHYTSRYCYTPSFTLHNQSKYALATHLSFGSNGRSYLPPGFPFHLNMVPYGSGSAVSYDSYEFLEDFTTRGGQRLSVRFEFTKPSRSSSSSKYFTWKIYPHDTRFHSYMRPTHKTPLAHVQVNPSVMDTNYGKHIRHNHRVITSALALSLDFGSAVITICEAKTLRTSKRFPRLCQSMNYPGPFHSKEILFVATYSAGYSEIVHVIECYAATHSITSISTTSYILSLPYKIVPYFTHCNTSRK